jgi:ABC-type branched-subunit amino acid transport system ATPase component/predicted MFS family arabinose efflux permease
MTATEANAATPQDSSESNHLGIRGWFDRLTEGGPIFALLILFGLNLVPQLDASAFGILIPNIRDSFHMNNSDVLSLVAVAGLVGLSMQVPIAQLADRTNRTRLMLLGAAICAGFVFGTGLAVTVWLLVIMRSGTGLGMATIGPTHNSLISDYYPINARPKIYSFHYAGIVVGAILGPIIAGYVAKAFGWRLPFVIFALPAVVLIVLGLRLKEPIRGIQERRAMGVTDALETEEPPPSFAEGWRMTWKIESLRRIFYSMPFLAASLIGFSSLAAILYQRKFGLDVVQRGWVATAAEPAQILGLIVGARVGSKLIKRDPGLIIRFLAFVAAFCAALLAVFALVPVLWVTILANILISASLAAIGSGIYSSLSLAIPARSRSLGFSMGALWVIPGLLVLPLIGAISDSLGIQVGMLVMVPVFLIGGLILSSAGNVIDRDISQVRTMAAARSEVLLARRNGEVKLLLVRGLCVAYGNVQILFDVDLEIGEGEIVALLGTNGAGKSTLLRSICGVVEADKGAVIFDGVDVTHAPPYEIAAKGITQVPGGQGVFPSLTVAENLRVAGWLDRRNAVLGKERLNEVIEMFPALVARMHDPAADLSGGQQQMLALSMAFLARPKLLMIDELSLGLAPVVIEQILPIIEAIRAQGTTIILVEQSVNLALTIAETAYFMEKGEIKFHGPTAELLERPDILRSVFLEGASARTTTTPPTAVQRSSRDETTEATAPALSVSNVTVRFGIVNAVSDVSFSVAEREVVGIIGPNGAGKTTLFDAISGFTPTQGGQIFLGETDLTKLGPARRARAGLGRSFQDAQLFAALTVEETIAVAFERWISSRDPLSAALHLPTWRHSEHKIAEDVDELIELLGLESFRTKFVRELSTGSRRIVDLACSMAHKPSVILLDEPSSGIAQRESEALGPLLRGLRDVRGISLVVIEHDMALISSMADRLIVLDQGELLSQGIPEEVLREDRVVSAYLGSSEAARNRSGNGNRVTEDEL